MFKTNIFRSVGMDSALYVIFLTGYIGLIWILPYFPSQDGPSHIYNLVILKDLLNGGKDWGNFFSYQLHAVPNLGFNLIAYPLLTFFSPLKAEKIFISIYILSVGACVPFYLRAFDRPYFPLSFLAFPVVFNFCTMMGFYSYVIAVPAFLFAFALAWRIRKCSAVLKFIVLNLSGFILFYLHLIPYVFFLLALMSICLAEGTKYRERIFASLKIMLTVSPTIAGFILYLINSPGNPAIDFSYLLSKQRTVGLVADLLFFSTVNISPLQILPLVFIFSFLLLILFRNKTFFPKKAKTGNLSTSERAILYLSAILLVVYFMAPFRFGDGCYFNERFPWVIFLVLLPMFHIPGKESMPKRFVSILLIGIVTLHLVVNSIALWQKSSVVEKFLSGLKADLPKGALIMTHKAESLEWSTVDVLLHTLSYYCIYKGCVDVGNYEANLQYFPVRFKNGFPAIPSQDQIAYEPTTIDWSAYPSIDYVLAWQITINEGQKLSKFFRVIYEDCQLSIWRRNTPRF